ncbi:MAG: LCP family protein [Minisyncoccia bacterium]
MKKASLFLIFFIFLLIILYSLIFIIKTPKKLYIFQNLQKLFTLSPEDSILFLGKMGPGYYGGENTDAIFLVYIKDNKVYIIHIPRDLIVNINGDLYKINSLYGFKKIDRLLDEVNNLTGIKTKYYIVFDSYILKTIIDKMGGLDVDLKYPVTDAVSGYTLYPGKYHLSGDWIEWVVRSRYNPEGDFYRMRNQFIILKSLKNQLEKMPEEKIFEILNLINKLRIHYDTNLPPAKILGYINKIENIKNSDIKEIVFDFNSGVWENGYFNLKIGGQEFNAYGLIPKDGIGKYYTIRKKIKESIKD